MGNLRISYLTNYVTKGYTYEVWHGGSGLELRYYGGRRINWLSCTETQWYNLLSSLGCNTQRGDYGLLGGRRYITATCKGLTIKISCGARNRREPDIIVVS